MLILVSAATLGIKVYKIKVRDIISERHIIKLFAECASIFWLIV